MSELQDIWDNIYNRLQSRTQDIWKKMYDEMRLRVEETWDSFLNRMRSIDGDKAAPFLVIIIIFSYVVFSSFTIYRYGKMNQQEQMINDYEINFDILEEEYMTLFSRFITLTNYHETLIDVKDNLLLENENIRDTYSDQIKANITNQMQINQIKQENSLLIENITQLQDEYDLICEDYVILKDQLVRARAIENGNRTVHLEDNKEIYIESNDEIILEYNFEYAGLLIINFTSTDEVFFWIGSSLIGEVYYARYPYNWPETSSGDEIIVPIYGKTFVYLKNPNGQKIYLVLSADIIY